MNTVADDIDFNARVRETDPLLVAHAMEQSVLGALLLGAGPKEPPVPSDYASPDHRMIAAAIGACASRGAVDPVLVFAELQAREQVEECGGLFELNTLAAQVHPRAAVEQHARAVRAQAVERRAVGVRAQIAALAKGSGSLADVLPELRARIDELASGPALVRPAIAPRILALDQLAPQKAPPRHWFRSGWLGAGVTLFPGKGGEGKSTLAQHEATCGSLGRPYFAGESAPYASLIWNCEDEHDDLWRRQEQICQHEQIDMASLAGRLHLVSRYGCDNALMVESHGTVVPTRLLEELRQQVNDLHIDVLWLDNAAHLLAGNHDDRSQATQFINALNSLVTGRPLGVVLLAHVSRAQGSEYSGSVAWENAARMRWYLGPRLPDAPIDAGEDLAPSDVRYLCKRKSNYSARDYARFSMRSGVLVPDQIEGERVAGLVSALDEERAEQHCVAGFRTLNGMGIRTTDGKTSPDYLPSQLVAKGLAPGYSKADLGRAMNRLMGRGVFVRGVVGKHPNRSEKFGLVLGEGQS